MRRTRAPGFDFTSYLDDIQKELDKYDAQVRKEAAQHVAQRMRKNLGNRGPSSRGGFPGWKTKTLRKGIGIKGNVRARGERAALVGSRAPHTHLVEFGHGDGKAKNKRPFFRRTFNEETAWVEKKMREPWIK